MESQTQNSSFKIRELTNLIPADGHLQWRPMVVLSESLVLVYTSVLAPGETRIQARLESIVKFIKFIRQGI
jgi:hypothetical protein